MQFTIKSPVTAKLRTQCDNKIETVRIGDKAGVPSVPNVLGRADTYQELCDLATEAGRLAVTARFEPPLRDTIVYSINRDQWESHA